jgi:outer membrane lipoprotein-sorting protein
MRLALAILAIASGRAGADPAPSEAPPANLLRGEARGAAIDPVFALFKVDRLSCKFSEAKHIALLARPLRSTGTIYFERVRGIARTTLTPKPQQIVLTPTTLRIHTAQRTEEIPLDKSKDLKAFALIFPTLLRGDRVELERSFVVVLHGSEHDRWALDFTPRTESMKKLIKRVVVSGKQGEVTGLKVIEASGDTTDTVLTEVRRNDDVPEAELAAAFGAP